MSSRWPNMPTGSLTCSWPSTMKKREMLCSTSRLVGRLSDFAPSIALSMSSSVIARCLPGIVLMPRLFTEVVWLPPMLTWADIMRLPLDRSARSTEPVIASVAFWMSSTMPFFTPCEGVIPTPRTRRSSSGVTSATKVQILLLPTSMPASMLSLNAEPPVSLE